jgi:hypothetical protein
MVCRALLFVMIALLNLVRNRSIRRSACARAVGA